MNIEKQTTQFYQVLSGRGRYVEAGGVRLYHFNSISFDLFLIVLLVDSSVGMAHELGMTSQPIRTNDLIGSASSTTTTTTDDVRSFSLSLLLNASSIV